MKTHPLNVSHLVFGLVFLGIAGSWALRASDLVGPGAVHWLLPLTLIVAGAAGLVAFAAKGLGRRDQAPQTYDTYDTDTYDTRGEDR